LDVGTIALVTTLHSNTVNRHLALIRQHIADLCEEESPFEGEIEVDESYFGAKRVKGKRGHGAGRKTAVFGVIQRKGSVYTDIVPDCARKTLQAIIRGRVKPDSIIHADSWRGYTGLVDVGYKKHYRVRHGNNEFARGKSHINGIESFRSCAKRRLMKFHGIPQSTFYLHLKECEFRCNNPNTDIYKLLLKNFKNKPLS
jgi:transposase-like protein